MDIKITASPTQQGPNSKSNSRQTRTWRNRIKRNETENDLTKEIKTPKKLATHFTYAGRILTSKFSSTSATLPTTHLVLPSKLPANPR